MTSQQKSARQAFREFAALFHERLFMNLVCFADETGTHDPSGRAPGAEVAGVVGCISEKGNWADFCGQWEEVLDRYKVKVFHMSEFSKPEKDGLKDPSWPYRGWGRKKMDSFIRELVPIARDNTMFAVGGFVDVKAHYGSVPEWLKSDAEKFPYYVCFQAFFDQLLVVVRDKLETPLDPGDQIAFFFGQQDQFKELALQLFGQIKQFRDSEDRMGAITFAETIKYPPLQAADLMAYRMRKLIGRKRANKPVVAEGSWDEELESRHNLIMGYLEGDNLQPIVDKVIAARLEMIAAAIKKG
jgi:hypothetical protein